MDGTNQTTALGLSYAKASKIVLIALQAMKVLPPAVGTFTQICGTRATLFL